MNKQILIFPVTFLLIFLPFWDVIVPLSTKLSSVFFYVIGPVRYEVMIIASFFMIFLILRNRCIYVNFWKLLPIIYFIFCGLSLIYSDVNLILKLEAFKLQLIILVFCSLLSITIFYEQLISIVKIKKIFYYQLLLVLFVGFIEYLHQDILSFLYNKSLSEISHINYFTSKRLISLIGNPINLGAFIIVCLSFNLDFFIKKSNIILKIIIILLSFFVVYMTLSRLALISFVILLIMILRYRNIGLLIISLGMLITLLILIIPYVNVTDSSFERMVSVLNFDTYKENLRVIHWGIAFSDFNSWFDYLFGLGFGISNPSQEYMNLYKSFVIENVFVSVFIENGIIGLSLFLLILCRYIYTAKLFYKKTKDPSFICFILMFIVFSFGNDFHRNMPFSFYFWMFYVWLEVYLSKINK